MFKYSKFYWYKNRWKKIGWENPEKRGLKKHVQNSHIGFTYRTSGRNIIMCVNTRRIGKNTTRRTTSMSGKNFKNTVRCRIFCWFRISFLNFIRMNIAVRTTKFANIKLLIENTSSTNELLIKFFVMIIHLWSSFTKKKLNLRLSIGWVRKLLSKKCSRFLESSLRTLPKHLVGSSFVGSSMAFLMYSLYG